MPPTSSRPALAAAGVGMVLAALSLAAVAAAEAGRRRRRLLRELRERRNYNVTAATDAELRRLRDLKWEAFPEHEIPGQHVSLNGQEVALRPGLTLTPYANAVQCNASCCFCSEELERTDTDGDRTSSKALPAAGGGPGGYERYFATLARLLEELKDLKVGLSLSGLEATAEPNWFRGVMEVVAASSTFDEKVLCTNASGFADASLVPCLRAASFDRVEVSRQHDDEGMNQKIMRFGRHVAVRCNDEYAAAIQRLHGATSCVMNSCLLSQVGISTVEDVERYVAWAASLGIKDIVFREISRLDSDIFSVNRVASWIESNRVSVDSLLEVIAPSLGSVREGWTYRHSRVGYYYYNEVYDNRGSHVQLAVPSYAALSSSFSRGVVDKLILWGDLTVTSDWDHRVHKVASYASPDDAPGAVMHGCAPVW